MMSKKYDEIINYIKNETTEFVKWYSCGYYKEMPEFRKVVGRRFAERDVTCC